jgi:DNA-directed RNA polymerase specialized sigma24 family protein
VAAITITEAEERELVQRAGQYTRPYREVIRAKIVLLAADGLSDQEIAERLDCTDRTASTRTQPASASWPADFASTRTSA